MTFRFLVVTCFIMLAAFVSADFSRRSTSDSYWIVFQTLSGGNGNGNKALMKIDETGSVVQNPRAVVSGTQFKGSDGNSGPAAALVHGRQGELNLFVPGKDRHIKRFVINKRSLNIVSAIKTKRITANHYRLDAAEKGDNDFLAFESAVSEERYYLSGYPLTPSGAFKGILWLLATKPLGRACDDLEGCGGGTSSDGNLMYFIASEATNKTQLYVQRLNGTGRPLGKTLLVWEFTGSRRGGIRGADVSGSTESGDRFVVWNSAPEFPGDEQDDSIFLRRISINPLTVYGDRTLIRRASVLGRGQGLVIDPKGRFLVYVLSSDYVTNRYHDLVFQPLDSTGRPNGKTKILATDVHSPVDILLEQP